VDLELRILNIGFEGLRFWVSGVGVQCLCNAIGIGLRARTEGSCGDTFFCELKRTCDCQITVPPLALPESQKWLKYPASCADSAGFPPADCLATSWRAGARPFLWILKFVREKSALNWLFRASRHLLVPHWGYPWSPCSLKTPNAPWVAKFLVLVRLTQTKLFARTRVDLPKPLMNPHGPDVGAL